MVMQYLGEIYTMTPWGTPSQFRVFRCGDDKWLLFDPIDSYGCSILQQFPVKRADLKPHVRRTFRANVAGGVYTTAARNEYDAKQGVAKIKRDNERIRNRLLGEALDVIHG